MEIVKLIGNNIRDAGKIHSESWKESHKSFCSEEFVARHTAEAQTEYIRAEIAKGKDFNMLVDNHPIAIVSVKDSLIENLYVLPNEQRRGYGAKLLQHALKLCTGVPTLWILSNNKKAYSFYTKHGFVQSGNTKQLRNDLLEIEMVKRS